MRVPHLQGCNCPTCCDLDHDALVQREREDEEPATEQEEPEFPAWILVRVESERQAAYVERVKAVVNTLNALKSRDGGSS
jgi:hypothetical protein